MIFSQQFHHATQLNNQGVFALKEGKPKIAIQLLADAVKILKRCSADEEDMEVSTTSASSAVNGNLASVGMFETSSVSILNLESSGALAIFSQANIITQKPAPASILETGRDDAYITQGHYDYGNRNGEASSKICVAAVLFNLALAYHLAAASYRFSSHNTNNKIKTTCILAEKAEKLYSMVLEFLCDDSHDLGSSHTGLITRLACINNLFHIQRSVIDFALGDAQYILLQRIALLYRHGAASPSFTEPDVQGLLFGLVMMLEQSSPIAAAAAA